MEQSNKGDVHRVLLYDCQKIGTAIVYYYFFSLAGPRDNKFVFAILAKLGSTPQMDVGPYTFYSDNSSFELMFLYANRH